MQYPETQKLLDTDVFTLQNQVVEELFDGNFLQLNDIENLYDPEYPDEMIEVFQWWSVSDRLADQLLEEGHPVIKNEHGTWWGRPTYGQALYMDYVLRKIAGEAD